MFQSRRGFLQGLVSTLAAPAIVHAGNLMPIRRLPPDIFTVTNPYWPIKQWYVGYEDITPEMFKLWLKLHQEANAKMSKLVG